MAEEWRIVGQYLLGNPTANPVSILRVQENTRDLAVSGSSRKLGSSTISENTGLYFAKRGDIGAEAAPFFVRQLEVLS